MSSSLKKINQMQNEIHERLLREIPWVKNSYLKEKKEGSEIEKYYLQESQDTHDVRKEYSHQQESSNMLLQLNENKVQKLNYLSSLAEKSKMAKKCLICKKINVLRRFFF